MRILCWKPFYLRRLRKQLSTYKIYDLSDVECGIISAKYGLEAVWPGDNGLLKQEGIAVRSHATAACCHTSTGAATSTDKLRPMQPTRDELYRGRD
jgi:hypothetical protein